MSSPLVKRQLKEKRRLQDIEDARQILAKRKAFKQDIEEGILLQQQQEERIQHQEEERREREEEKRQEQEEEERREQEEEERREREEGYNIVDRPLKQQLNDEISNLGEIDNNIDVDRNASGIHRSPSQPIRSQEGYDLYTKRVAKQRALLERSNRINKFQNDNQTPKPKKTRISWKGGGKSRRTHKRKQSKKVKRRNTKKNKKRCVKR